MFFFRTAVGKWVGGCVAGKGGDRVFGGTGLVDVCGCVVGCGGEWVSGRVVGPVERWQGSWVGVLVCR